MWPVTSRAPSPGKTVENLTPQPVYDTDADGLIEITTLAQLDAIRHDLDGDGTPTGTGATAYATAFPDATRVVCDTSSGRCEGYELMTALDFDTNGDGQVDADDTYWDNGAGWEPLGYGTTGFAATFDGNGHTIAHLYVNRGRTGGLFSATSFSGSIRHVGLIDMVVMGGDDLGGLVGNNNGRITGSYATGRVVGSDNVGGLVGSNGGDIHTSYATGRVEGSGKVGGLAGGNDGEIHTSYAAGRVMGERWVGGLVGGHDGEIHNSYATGWVSGQNHVGGLVGIVPSNSPITASYWDTTTSGWTSGSNGTGQTTRQLQTPSSYSRIYADWNVDLDGGGTNDDPWDFGTSSQYPALAVDFDGNGDANLAGVRPSAPSRAAPDGDDRCGAHSLELGRGDAPLDAPTGRDLHHLPKRQPDAYRGGPHRTPVQRFRRDPRRHLHLPGGGSGQWGGSHLEWAGDGDRAQPDAGVRRRRQRRAFHRREHHREHRSAGGGYRLRRHNPDLQPGWR